eukprot:TRINITY_DN1025_c0_g1_i2.p1 TRINITY_DN1025_c0_g1~~TRINITY_DN1025_c0_g1_i2.p1  ORF type:complete len:294 (+),score=98.19 TRINITY_DN1025_c0_g1_i2:143-1024(+)
MFSSSTNNNNNEKRSSFLTCSQEGDVCPLCIDFFDDPISLPCNHDFCLECLQMIRKERTNENGKKEAYIQCPLCREETVFDIKDTTFKDLKRNDDLRNSSEIKKVSFGDDNLDQELLLSLEKTQIVSVPRNMKLLQEYDAAIGKEGLTWVPEFHRGYINYGINENLVNAGEYMRLSNWTAMVIAPQDSPIGQLIYFLEINIPDTYPTEPPIINFTFPKINMDCVGETGFVQLDKIELVDITQIDAEGMVDNSLGKYKWDPSQNIVDALVAIRENIHMRKVCTGSSGLGQLSYV